MGSPSRCEKKTGAPGRGIPRPGCVDFLQHTPQQGCGGNDIKQASNGRCPYQADGKLTPEESECPPERLQIAGDEVDI